MHPFKVGLLGYGRIAGIFHLDVLAALPRVQVAAIAEPDPERRARAARRVPRARLFADYRELLDASDAEAVVICLPPALHAAAAIAALRSGRHVYIEKPLAIEPAEGAAVLDAWRAAGTTAMVGFNFRFHPVYQGARRWLCDGILGPLAAARSVFSIPAHELPPWKRSRSTGGGVLLDLASHHVDLVRHLFDDEVETVFAHLRSQRSEMDGAALDLRLASGLVVQSFFSLASVNEDRFEIFGEMGMLHVDRVLGAGPAILKPYGGHLRRRRLWSGLRLLQPHRLLVRPRDPSFRRALHAFVSAARSGEPVRPDPEDGFRSLAVLAAAEESARTGRSVPPDAAPRSRATAGGPAVHDRGGRP